VVEVGEARDPAARAAGSMSPAMDFFSRGQANRSGS